MSCQLGVTDTKEEKIQRGDCTASMVAVTRYETVQKK